MRDVDQEEPQRQSPELKPVPVPLVGSLSKSLETLTEQAQLKGVSLSVEGVDDVIVYANEEDVQRILANLLENAVQTPRPATTSKSALPQCGQLMNEWASSGTRSSTLAATLAAAGRRTGLLDLDFTGPCGHLVLGALPVFPDEDFGILAQQVAGVHFMSIACFAGATPAPLRGADVSNALIELLAITRWGELDTLVIDMPPGLGDAALDIVRLLPRAQYLVVTSSARLVVETVRRTLTLLHRSDQQALGLIENMAPSPTPSELVAELAGEFAVPLLWALPFDVSVEACIGDPEALRATPFGHAAAQMANKYL